MSDLVERLQDEGITLRSHSLRIEGFLMSAASEITTLRTELAEQARLNGLSSEREARLMARVVELTALLDQHLGTPCEQIRHEQAEEEAYRRGVEDAAKVAGEIFAGHGAHLGFEGRRAAAAIRSLTAPDKEGA